MPEHKYNASCEDIAMWKQHELAHVGRIAAMKDKDLQYSYALSTVNGMVHLRDAIYEKVVDPKNKDHLAKVLNLRHQQREHDQDHDRKHSEQCAVGFVALLDAPT